MNAPYIPPRQLAELTSSPEAIGLPSFHEKARDLVVAANRFLNATRPPHSARDLDNDPGVALLRAFYRLTGIDAVDDMADDIERDAPPRTHAECREAGFGMPEL